MMFFGLPGICFLLFPILFGSKEFIPLFFLPFAILISIPMRDLFSHLFPNVFFAYRWRDRPKPTFSIVRGLKKEHRYTDALAELHRMAEEESQEVDIWLEMLEIALIDLRDTILGEKIFREGISILETQSSRDMIQRFYSNIVK